MSGARLISRRQFEFRAYTRLLRQWDWEWMATLTFPDRFREYKNYIVKNRVFQWTRRLCVDEGLQVAYYYILCRECGHPHFHILMLGRNRDQTKTLDDVSHRKWARNWYFFAEIKKVTSVAKAAKYLAKHTYYSKCQQYEIDSYNHKLLKLTRNFYTITA